MREKERAKLPFKWENSLAIFWANFESSPKNVFGKTSKESLMKS